MASRARRAPPDPGVHVGPLPAEDQAQVQRRLGGQGDRGLEHQAAGADVHEPGPDHQHRLGELLRLEARRPAPLDAARPGGTAQRDHGTSRTTRKP